MEKQIRQGRSIQMDLLRIVACIMVIITHVVVEGIIKSIPGTFQWYVLLVFNVLARPAVPLFFALSGMFSRSTDWKKSVKKVLKYVGIFLMTTVLYQTGETLEQFYISKTLEGPLGAKLLSIFTEGIVNFKYHLWFLPEYMFILLMAPVFNAALEKKPELIDYLAGWFLLSTILPESIKILLAECRIVRVWLNALPDLSMGYLGYFVLGRWIQERKTQIGTGLRRLLIALGGLGFVLVFVCTDTLSTRNGGLSDWYYSNFFIAQCAEAVGLLLLFDGFSIPKRWNGAITWMAAKGMGVYLLHAYVIEELSRRGFWVQRITTIIGVPLKTSLVFGICCLCLWGWDKLCSAVRRGVKK